MKKIIGVFSLLIFLSKAFSEDHTIAQLSIKIEQLENRVTILESLIAGQARGESAVSNAVRADKKAWRKLSKGMKMDEVRKLLGEPLTV